MRRCEDCKIILDNDVRFCPKCGNDVASGAKAGPSPIMDVPKLLAEANLHKSRQEWDEAIAAATDALRLEPKNADVAVGLGSIYEEREMLDEALVWYQMALELDADSRQGKAGRDRVGMLSSARRKAAASAPKGSTKLTMYIAAGAGVLLLLVIVLLIAASVAKGHRPTGISTAAQSNTPISQPGIRRATAAAPRSTLQPLSGATIPTGSASPSALHTSAEDNIRSGLNSDQAVTSTGASIDDVIADPRTGVATVTFSVPLKGMVTKDQISRAAVAVVKKTFELHQAVKFVTARCLVQVPGADGTQVAFVGDIARESVTPSANDQQIAAAFSHPWWNPQISK